MLVCQSVPAKFCRAIFRVFRRVVVHDHDPQQRALSDIVRFKMCLNMPKDVFLLIFFTDCTMVNYHEPPFGIICLELVPSIKQANPH